MLRIRTDMYTHTHIRRTYMLTWHACERLKKHMYIYKIPWIQINRCVSIVFVITCAKLVTMALQEQWWQRRRLLIFSSRLKLANKPNSKLVPPRHLNVVQKESNRTPPTTWPTYALNRRPGSCYPTPKCGCFRFGCATRILPLPVWSHCNFVGPKRKPDHANIGIDVEISLISGLGVEIHAFQGNRPPS